MSAPGDLTREELAVLRSLFSVAMNQPPLLSPPVHTGTIAIGRDLGLRLLDMASRCVTVETLHKLMGPMWSSGHPLGTDTVSSRESGEAMALVVRDLGPAARDALAQKGQVSDKFVCTAANPWSEEKAARATHPDAVCTYDGGMEQEYERYECPHCKLSFKVEIAQ